MFPLKPAHTRRPSRCFLVDSARCARDECGSVFYLVHYRAKSNMLTAAIRTADGAFVVIGGDGNGERGMFRTRGIRGLDGLRR